jgi:hypothetical protein
MQQGCPGDQIQCGAECSTLLDDVRHCGNCRTACPQAPDRNALAECIQAECYLKCAGSEGQPVDVDFDNDPQNCGRCGIACPTVRGGEATCRGGRCQSPCREGTVQCQDRCVPAGRQIGENCNGACCPVVRPGVQHGDVIIEDSARAYTIQVDGPHHVRARIRFGNGTCPGFGVFSNANETFTLSVNSTDDLGNEIQVGRGRPALGDGGWCAVADAEVQGGTYDVLVQASGGGVPAYDLEIAVDAPTPARNGQRVDRSGIYAQAIPAEGQALLPLHLDRASRVLVIGMANDPNSGFPEACLYGEMDIQISENILATQEDRNCPVMETVLAAGDYTIRARRTFGDADASFRAAVILQPIGGGAPRPLDDQGGASGGPIGEFAMDRLTFHLDAPSDVTLSLTGDGCQQGSFDLVIDSGVFDVESMDDQCPTIQFRQVVAGDHEIWVHGAKWASLPQYSLVTSLAGGPLGGGGIRGAGTFRRGAIAAGQSDRFIWHSDRAASVEMVTGGDGGCPGDTVLSLQSPDGDEIGSDDDGAGGGCSRLVVQVGVGDYTVDVHGYDGRAIPAYTLTIVYH